ncbi:MAG: PQQ-binding-like beta-propeller repeat protein [Candidatus Brocadiia bacterium]
MQRHHVLSFGRRPLMPICLVLLVSLASAAEPPSKWSSFAGDGDFVPARQGLKLIADPVDIRVDWKNRTHTGIGKGGGGTLIRMHEAGFEPAYGEVANLIVGDGVVFCSWSQPSGHVYVPKTKLDHRYYDEDEKARIPRSYFRVHADWRTIALDADTGRTLWQTGEPNATTHLFSSKRGHVGNSGAYGEGVYVTLTLLGEAFAYDAEDGQRLWKAVPHPPYRERAQEQKARFLEQQNLPVTESGNPFSGQRSGAAIAAGVAAVPDLTGGLVGLDLRNGKRLWRVEGALQRKATPQVWTHDGKQWLLCNGRGTDDPDLTSTIRLIDPKTGAVAWRHASGNNPGWLVFGDRFLMLDLPDHPAGRDKDWQKDRGVYAAYRLSPEGLAEGWRFADTPQTIIDYRCGHMTVIRDGVLYGITGKRKSSHRRLRSYDVTTGKLLHEEPQPTPSNILSQPRPCEDKLYVKIDGAHSGAFAGLLIYQLKPDGGFERLGDIRYKRLGIKRMGGYAYLAQDPYYDGRMYLRGHHGIFALELRAEADPIVRLQFHDFWAGSPQPVQVRLYGNDEGHVQSGKWGVPTSADLGIVFTTGRRGDGWTTIAPKTPLPMRAGGEGIVTMNWTTFQTDVQLRFDPPRDGRWTGTWQRHIPGLDKPRRLQGKIGPGSLAGLEHRVYPTPWLKNQPFTKLSNLPHDQQRLILQLPDALVNLAVEERLGDRAALTVCLDYDSQKFTAGVGGAFHYNQAWHEIDSGGLKLTDDRLTGSMTVILHPDPWWAPNPRNNGSLAGRIELDATFGAEDDQGRRTISGNWSATWGIELTRSGRITTQDADN